MLTSSATAPWRAFRIPAIALGALMVLCVVTTGWTAFERGLFQDDAAVLFKAFTYRANNFPTWFLQPITTPTRRLQGIPYALALTSGQPLLFLRLAGELVPFAIALLAMKLAQDALELGPAGSFVAGALVATASSDWLTGSLVAMGYNMAVALHLAGALGLVRWTRDGKAIWLVTAIGCGIASLWTIDVATTVHPLTPLLALLVCTDRASRRRLALATGLWFLCAAPYYLQFARFMLDPAGYAADALVIHDWPSRLQRGAELVAYNFLPWRWAFWRSNWFRPPPPTLSLGLKLALTSIGLGVAGWAFVALNRADRARTNESSPWPSALPRIALLLLFTVLANATFMAVQVSEFRYRTQLLSRVWASLALAVLFVALRSRRSMLWRGVAAAGVTAFVGLGMLGGLERQDYFASYWQRHVTELGSIADALPSLLPETRLLLRLPPHPFYTATEAGYLARVWVTLLGENPALECRAALLATGRANSCEAGPLGLVCKGEPRTGFCIRQDNRMDTLLPYNQLVILTYDGWTNQYHLEAEWPADLPPVGKDAAAAISTYAPTARIVRGPVSRLASLLLDRPRQLESPAQISKSH